MTNDRTQEQRVEGAMYFYEGSRPRDIALFTQIPQPSVRRAIGRLVRQGRVHKAEDGYRRIPQPTIEV